jgi:hypothetical protein
MNKCLNWSVCGNLAAKGFDLCDDCKKAIRLLMERDDPKQTLARLERKPRNIQDVWKVKK